MHLDDARFEFCNDRRVLCGTPYGPPLRCDNPSSRQEDQTRELPDVHFRRPRATPRWFACSRARRAPSRPSGCSPRALRCTSDNSVQRQTGIRFQQRPEPPAYIADQQTLIASINALTPVFAQLGAFPAADDDLRRSGDDGAPHHPGEVSADRRHAELRPARQRKHPGGDHRALWQDGLGTERSHHPVLPLQLLQLLGDTAVQLSTQAKGDLNRLDLELTPRAASPNETSAGGWRTRPNASTSTRTSPARRWRAPTSTTRRLPAGR